jgi:hypothetical protein
VPRIARPQEDDVSQPQGDPMRRLLVAAAILAPGCGRTVVDVGANNSDGGVDNTPARWTHNESSCPSERPSLDDTTACAVPEWQSCGYWWQGVNGRPLSASCTCFEKDRSTRLWHCTEYDADLCPAGALPETGSDCSGLHRTACVYPVQNECTCADPNEAVPHPAWQCHDPLHAGNPAVAGLADLPMSAADGVPGDKEIKDLSDTEAAAWCNWFYKLYNGDVGVPIPEIDADGYIAAIGTVSGSTFFARACVPVPPPVEFCVMNLRVQPCEATVDELTDCVRTLHDNPGFGNLPSPHGCGRFLEGAHCDGTIVQSFAAPASAAGDTGSAPSGTGGGEPVEAGVRAHDCTSLRVR